MLCGGKESETCCSHVDLTNALYQWNTSTKSNVYAYLETYKILAKTILNYYEDVIVLSKYVYLSPKSSKVCKKSAEYLVSNYIFKEDLNDFMTKFETFLGKLKNYRKGFYCSLCSVKN